MKGELHSTLLTTACEADLHMDDSFNEFDLVSGVATSRDSNGITMYLPLGCLTISTTRYVIRSFPLGGGGRGGDCSA